MLIYLSVYLFLVFFLWVELGLEELEKPHCRPEQHVTRAVPLFLVCVCLTFSFSCSSIHLLIISHFSNYLFIHVSVCLSIRWLRDEGLGFNVPGFWVSGLGIGDWAAAD